MSSKIFKNAIALTGGIATGKSTVCNILKLYGFLTIDADKIAHKLLDQHHQHIAQMFGSQYVKDGKVIRKELGKIIFSDEVQKKRLEAFIHPLIKEDIIKEASIFEKANKSYLIDIPLFFETMNYDIDRSLVVYTPSHIQCERLMKRDKIDEKEARQKMSNQMDIEKKKELADFCIDNSTTLRNLQSEIERIIGEIS